MVANLSLVAIGLAAFKGGGIGGTCCEVTNHAVGKKVGFLNSTFGELYAWTAGGVVNTDNNWEQERFNSPLLEQGEA